jgi:hypothetical protein
MRLLLFILGVFATVVCIEKPAEAEQNYPWCINKPDESPQCRYATFEHAWLTGLGKARLVHLVHTRRHRNHVHQTGPRGAKWLRLAQKLRLAIFTASQRQRRKSWQLRQS